MIEKKKSRKKLGEIALDFQAKELVETRPISINELSKNILYGQADGVTEGVAKGYLSRVWDEAVDAFEKLHTDVCFIEVRYKSMGALAHNTTDKLFIGRRSCPTPDYNQDAFRVHNDGSIEFLWSLPSKLDVYILLEERHKLVLDPEYGELVRMVIDFSDGTLLRLAQTFDAQYDEMIKGNA